jgi:hypothetical protein
LNRNLGDADGFSVFQSALGACWRVFAPAPEKRKGGRRKFGGATGAAPFTAASGPRLPGCISHLLEDSSVTANAGERSASASDGRENIDCDRKNVAAIGLFVRLGIAAESCHAVDTWRK